VLRFSFQGNENSGDKHEIVSIPFTNPDRFDSSKSYYARYCIGDWVAQLWRSIET